MNIEDDVHIGIEDFSSQNKKLEEQRLAQAAPEEPQANLKDTSVQASNPEKDNLYTSNFTDKHRFYGRALSFCIVVMIMVMGRFSVPDNEVRAIYDKAFIALEPITKFLIATPGNERFRDSFQILCSFLMDSVFILTFGYWVLNGKTIRIVFSLAVFYLTRALIQSMFWSPFPPMFYWYDPGVPSLVVPYGRGSDFFFSGHSGFLVLCANEWHKIGIKKMRNFVILVLGYTIFTLLVYRIHYSIDIFAGVFYADWCFHKVDLYKDSIDGFFGSLVGGVKKIVFKKLKQ